MNKYKELFDHMNNEHGLILMETEMQEIRDICARIGECSICGGSGWNHGAQCKPSKLHPTGYKTVRCDCGS